MGYIKARNLNLRNGLIQGRSDGLNYANDIYDIYVGYCLYATLETALTFFAGTLTEMTESRTLPTGVYLISGIIVLTRGNATYADNNSFNTSWVASNGITPDTSNRQFIPGGITTGLRVNLPTTYLIITNTSGGTVSPRYDFNVFSGGSTTKINYEITIIRIA